MVFCTCGEPGRAVMGAKRDGTGDQTLGNIRVPEQRNRNGKDHEGDDKQGYAAVGEDCADQDHGEDGLVLAELFSNKMGNRGSKAGGLHNLREHTSEQIEGEIALRVVGEAAHVGFRIVRHDVGIHAGGKHDGDHRHNGRDDDNAMSLESQIDQQEQRQE